MNLLVFLVLALAWLDRVSFAEHLTQEIERVAQLGRQTMLASGLQFRALSAAEHAQALHERRDLHTAVHRQEFDQSLSDAIVDLVENGDVKEEALVEADGAQFIALDARIETVLPADEVANLKVIPGADMLGMGIDIKRGISLDSNTRSFLRPLSELAHSNRTTPFPLGGNTVYACPPHVLPRRMFDAHVETQVFSSLQGKMLAIDASLALEVTVMGIGGSAEIKMHFSSDDKHRVMYSDSDLNVKMYELSTARLSFEHLDPEFLFELDSLPNIWEANPSAFYAFLARWGTHYVKTASLGGQYRVSSSSVIDSGASNFDMSIAVGVVLKLGPLEARGKVKMGMGVKQFAKSMNSKFDYFVRGGSVALAAVVAEAQENIVNKGLEPDQGQMAALMDESSKAITRWLKSLRTNPVIYKFGLGSIIDIANLAANGKPERLFKINALERAIEVFFKDPDPAAMTVELQPGAPEFFSNFLRPVSPPPDMVDPELGSCVAMLAAVGSNNNFIVRMTDSVSKTQAGYAFEIGARQTRLLRGGVPILTSNNVEVVHPGTPSVYGSFMFCNSESSGAVMLARNGRVLLAYRDTAPLTVRFFGLRTTGTERAVIANIQATPLSDLQCPVYRGRTCNNRGQCDDTRQCLCDVGWKGSKCHLPCPVSSDNQTCGGLARGTCAVADPNDDQSVPFCACRYGFLGAACDVDASLMRGRIIAPPVVMSDRSAKFVLELQTQTVQGFEILRVPTKTISWQLVRSDGGEPVTGTGSKFERQIQPGAGTMIMVRALFPHSDMAADAVLNVDVKDCDCSGRGKCNDKGVCVCTAGFSGASCDDVAISMSVRLPPMPANGTSVYVYRDFDYALADVPSEVQVSCKNDKINATVQSISTRGVQFKVTPQETFPATNTFELTFTGKARIVPSTQTGNYQIPPTQTGPVFVNIRFPEPWPSIPHIAPEMIGVCCGLKFSIETESVTTNTARFRVFRSGAGVAPTEGWTQSAMKLRWTARAFAARDVPDRGVFSVGAAPAGGPLRLFVPFNTQPYRQPPRVSVELAAQPDVENEVVSLRVESVMNHGFWLLASRSQSASDLDPWKSRIQAAWTTSPANAAANVGLLVDDPSDLNVELLTFSRDFALPFGDLPAQPVVISSVRTPGMGHLSCARLCIDNSHCLGFTYLYGAAADKYRDPTSTSQCRSQAVAENTAQATMRPSDAPRTAGLCFLKGMPSSTWQVPTACAVSAILPLNTGARKTELNVAVAVASGCDASGQWAKKNVSTDIARLSGPANSLGDRSTRCPARAAMIGLSFSSMSCDGGVYAVSECTVIAESTAQDKSTLIDPLCPTPAPTTAPPTTAPPAPTSAPGAPPGAMPPPSSDSSSAPGTMPPLSGAPPPSGTAPPSPTAASGSSAAPPPPSGSSGGPMSSSVSNGQAPPSSSSAQAPPSSSMAGPSSSSSAAPAPAPPQSSAAATQAPAPSSSNQPPSPMKAAFIEMQDADAFEKLLQAAKCPNNAPMRGFSIIDRCATASDMVGLQWRVHCYTANAQAESSRESVVSGACLSTTSPWAALAQSSMRCPVGMYAFGIGMSQCDGGRRLDLYCTVPAPPAQG